MISLIVTIIAHYKLFKKPNTKGPNFNWFVPLSMAWYSWRATYMWPWERKNS